MNTYLIKSYKIKDLAYSETRGSFIVNGITAVTGLVWDLEEFQYKASSRDRGGGSGRRVTGAEYVNVVDVFWKLPKVQVAISLFVYSPVLSNIVFFSNQNYINNTAFHIHRPTFGLISMMWVPNTQISRRTTETW